MRIGSELLQERIHQVEDAYTSCSICPRCCGTNRREGDVGYCGLGEDAHIYRELLHYGEEEALVPAYTVYLSGCSMRCAFCSEESAVTSPQTVGTVGDPLALASRINTAITKGAKTVQFVGGVPDVNLLFILRTLSHVTQDCQVVWNTNHFIEEDTLTWLDGVVDIWMVDLKFGNDHCARHLSGTPSYLPVVRDRLRILENMHGQLFIRHLLMPGHLECCTRPVIEEVARQYPNAVFNLMTAFLPIGERLPQALRRKTSEDERIQAVQWVQEHFEGPVLWNGTALS